MNYQAFSNDSLLMMYEAVRGALASDDASRKRGGLPRFGVRETDEWKQHSCEVEAELLRRALLFKAIDWTEEKA